MTKNKISLLVAAATLILASCTNDADKMGHSTPIDSTNNQGTAPATYGPDNPANDQDTNRINSSDTGTKVNMGPDNTR